MIDERTEILIAEGAFLEGVPAIVMTGHYRHVLKMTVAALVADRTIMRMVDHHPFNDRGSKHDRFRILNRDARALCGWGHAGHHNFPVRVVFVLELLDSALAARAHRTQGRMPAEIGQIESERQTGLQ